MGACLPQSSQRTPLSSLPWEAALTNLLCHMCGNPDDRSDAIRRWAGDHRVGTTAAQTPPVGKEEQERCLWGQQVEVQCAQPRLGIATQ